jgi:Aegerolysin
MAPTHQCHIVINNRTSSHIKLAKADTEWGGFEDGQSPVQDIPPKSQVKAFVAKGNFGAAGTEGTVVYQLQDDANMTWSINWDVPTAFWKKNKVQVTVSDADLSATIEGFNGSGNVESCIIKIGRLV